MLPVTTPSVFENRMSTKTAITSQDFETMSFDTPTELVRGELVPMNPPGMLHGVVCKNVAFVLEAWVRQSQAGQLATNDTGVITERDPDTVRGADVLFVNAAKIRPGSIPKGLLQATPDLCVEVLSPSDRWTETLAKVSDYLAAGVREVWVVDSHARNVQVFRADHPPTTLEEDASIASPDVLPEFSAKVVDFFYGI